MRANYIKIVLSLSLLTLIIFPISSFAMDLPAIKDCLEPCGPPSGPPGGAIPKTTVAADALVNRELIPQGLRSPVNCNLNDAKAALVAYLESIEGEQDELTLEALTHPEGGTIEDWVDFFVEKEIKTPWSDLIATYGFVGKQLVPTYSGNLPVDTSHITALIKCDKTSGEMNFVSFRGKFFSLFNARNPYTLPYVVKFAAVDGPGGAFDYTDALALAQSEVLPCETTDGTWHQFLYPGETRLTEALSIATTVPSDGSCGTPPLPGGRLITVSADNQEITIKNNYTGLDVSGHVYANVTTVGPYNPSYTPFHETVPLENFDVEAYDGGLCSNEQIVRTDQNGLYNISYPGSPSLLWCQANIPNSFDSRSECGSKLGFLEVRDPTAQSAGDFFNHGEDCTSGGSDVIFNGPDLTDMTEYGTAQANIFYHTEKVRSWILENIDAASAAAIESGIVNAEINLDPASYRDCYAYYDFSESKMQFVKDSTNCFNMAFDTPIYHEYGHFVDEILGDLSRTNEDYAIRIALSEGWGDAIAAIVADYAYIGWGAFKGGELWDNHIRDLSDDIQWFHPACLLETNPGNKCGVNNNEPCVCPQEDICDPRLFDNPSLQILDCRKYHYGEAWGSMIYELHTRLTSEYAGDSTYANQVILSALALDSRNITEGVINILQADNATVTPATTESPHLCTIQSVTDKFGFPRERVQELANFQDCFFKTYYDGSISPNYNYNAMFNTLKKDQFSDYFYASGFSRNGSELDTASKYFHTRIDEQGNPLPNWTPHTLGHIYGNAGSGYYNDRGEAVIDTADEYLVFGLAGAPINQPGGNFLLGRFNKNTASGFIQGYGPAPLGNDVPNPLNMAKSIAALNGGDDGFVIAGVTTQAAEGLENNCFPGVLCGDAVIGYVDSNFEPAGNPTGTDIFAFDPHVLGGSSQDIFQQAKQISSTELIIAGFLHDSTTRKAVLIKNEIGEPLTGSTAEQFTLDISPPTAESVYRDVIMFNDKLGRDAFLSVGFTGQSILISRVKHDFTDPTPEDWTIVLESTTPNTPEKATSVMEFADDGTGIRKFLVAGTSDDKIVLFKIDEDGNKYWCKKYKEFYSNVTGPNLAITTDGTGFLIVGQYHDPVPFTPSPAALMRITLDGDAPTPIEYCDGYDFPMNQPAQQSSVKQGISNSPILRK